MNLKSAIESILFIAGRPVNLKELARATGADQNEILQAIGALQTARQDSAVVILEQNESYLMTTAPESVEAVKLFLNTELREKLTEAAIETLAIVTYKQPVSRAEIEAIRGVNSQYTLRLLLMRGLIERMPHPKDSRAHLYRTTHEFMQHLGIKAMKDLPDFTELTAKVKPPEGLVESVTKDFSPSS